MIASADRLSVDVQNLQVLRARARDNDPEALMAAARQFEALMVQTLLKDLRENSLAGEDDVFANTGGLRMYRELLDQQWAQRITEGRGLGFAEMLVKQMTRQAQDGSEAVSSASEDAPIPAPQGANVGQAAQPQALNSGSSAPVARDTVSPGPAISTPDAGNRPGGQSLALGRKEAFIQTLLPAAQAVARETGLPASFILGHAALESGWGEREIAGADGSPSHNLFGIKAGAGWRGGVTETLTTEYQAGLAVKRTERFRAYGDYAEAFRDYARLLKERYAEALGAGEDALAFGRALADGGYATDPAYAEKIGRVIASVERTGV